MEVGQAVLALYFINSELDLAESMIFIILQIGKRDFEDSAFEGVIGILETSRSIYEGFANTENCISL